MQLDDHGADGGLGAPGALDRHAFRRHALDGAALYFQPATGVHVRVATAATRALRRQAPRVAMFGITNACNLRCDFCSRDTARASEWTVASAAAALRGLHDAGTLEVAYGGGEPFAFRGFAELVAELHETTALAQHVTTNGTLISEASWPAFAGKLGQVRISIYDEPAPVSAGASGSAGSSSVGLRGWRQAAEVLSSHGQLWGANVLVDAAALATLPALLSELGARGCADVSLLSYVGPARQRHLDGAGARRLAEVIGEAPLPCRLSVCFGARVPVPRLSTGDAPGDCGAGRDFLSITPDRRVQSCSFQERSLPGGTAAEILAAWRLEQAALAQPSPRAGCARLLPMASEGEAPPPIAIWRGFSGNNSGECVMVATFGAVADAEAYLAELAPGWVRDGDYSEAWRQLFADEQVAVGRADDDLSYRESPRELVAIGRTVVAAKYGLDEVSVELAALAWKRGARAVRSGIHLHGPATLVVAVRSEDAAELERLQAAPLSLEGCTRHAHGALLLLTVPVLHGSRTDETLTEARDEVLRLAGARPLAVELYAGTFDEREWVAARQRLGHRPAQVPRLWVGFWGEHAAQRRLSFAGALDDARVVMAGSSVLIDPAPDRKRLAVLGYRHGGSIQPLDSARLILQASVWYEPPPQVKGQRSPPGRVVPRDHAEQNLRALLPGGTELKVTTKETPPHRARAPHIEVITEDPTAALTALTGYARSVEAKLSVWVEEPDRLAALLRRVVADASAS